MGELAPLPSEPETPLFRPCKRSQRVENDRDIDALLKKGPGHGRDQAEGRESHGNARQAETDNNALPRDVVGPLRDRDGFRQTIAAETNAV